MGPCTSIQCWKQISDTTERRDVVCIPRSSGHYHGGLGGVQQSNERGQVLEKLFRTQYCMDRTGAHCHCSDGIYMFRRI